MEHYLFYCFFFFILLRHHTKNIWGYIFTHIFSGAKETVPTQDKIAVTSASTNDSATATTIRKRDRKVIKVFQALTVLFLASFLPLFLQLTNTIDNMLVLYPYFLNHFGNSIIYYVIDEEFRAEANRIRYKMKFWWNIVR